jgi:hypothetical protein
MSRYSGATQFVIFPTHYACSPGINSDTNFYKSTFAIPGKVFEFKDFLPPPPPPPPHGKPSAPSADDITNAVQACVDAAAKEGNSAIAYFPTGVYPLIRTVNLTGSDFYVGGTGCGSSLTPTQPPTHTPLFFFFCCHMNDSLVW